MGDVVQPPVLPAAEAQPTPAERLADATDANLQHVLDNTQIDNTYVREWRKFREWIDDERENGRIPAGPKYITRENVDLYFAEVVAFKNTTTDTAARVAQALQKYADVLEHQGEARFVVRNDSVNTSLKAQKSRHEAAIANNDEDPHKNLPTAVISPGEHMKALHSIVVRRDWQDFQLSWNMCDATFIRNSSFRKLRLCDLKLDKESHGPPPNGGPGRRRSMSYVLRPGGAHKDRFKYTHMVGNWRHKEWIRCPTGALAVNLMVRLRYIHHNELNFLVPADDEAAETRPMWWKKRLVQRWPEGDPGYKAAAKAYKEVLTANAINFCKVTHLRKSGMDNAGSRGVVNEQVGAMSKHRKDKQARYDPQLNDCVMHVQAGFSPKENYYVPRLLVWPPWTEEEMTLFVFPRIAQWWDERLSQYGDTSDAAQDFLNETLPFLALVAIQDGIYWIHDFPNHEVSIMLANIPGYAQFAVDARQRVRQHQDSIEQSRVDLLEGAASAAFHVLYRRVDDQANTVRELKDAIEKRELKQTPCQCSCQCHSQTVTTPRGEMETTLPLATPPRQEAAAGPICIDSVTNHLRAVPRLPEIPTHLPKTVYDCFFQHQENNLQQFDNGDKKDWPQRLRLAFSKRKYLYEQVRKRAVNFTSYTTFQERMQAAARKMDEERLEKQLASVDKYIQYLKGSDPSVRKRKKRSDEI